MTEADPVPQFSKAEFEPVLKDNHSHFVRALLFGAVGAVAGLALYAGVVIITNYEIGFVSLAVGWIVGKAIVTGSQGRTGLRYQITAALLTYFAVSMATIPIAIWQIRQMNVALAASAGGTKAPAASSTPTPATTLDPSASNDTALEPIRLSSVAGKLLMLGLSSPFLGLQEMPGGIISLIILAVGVRIAWKMTGTQQVVIQPSVAGPGNDDAPTSLGPESLMPSCRACGAALDADALVCASCQTLTHEEELTRLRTEALAFERNGQFSTARNTWIKMLGYLPPNTKQVGWLVTRIQDLEGVANAGAPAARSRGPRWLARLGPLAPILLALFKGKGLLALFNAKSLASLGLFIGFYGQQFGWAFGAGFAVAILIHEMGHYIDIRRRGLPADMPVFLPGLGAYVRWRALGVSSVVRAEVSLAGPLAGLMAAIACAVIWAITGSPFWAALGRAGAWLNVLNLVPVWALDGGQAASVLDRAQRIVLLSVAAVLWLALGEGVFLLVALGGVWRLFTRDMPAEPSRSTAIYFLGVLAALALTMYLLPGHGAGDL